MNMVYKILVFIIFAILLIPSVFAKEQRVYDLTLKYDKGIITKQSLIVTEGIFNEVKDQPEDRYRLELRSFESKTLYTQKFSFDLASSFLAPPGTFDKEGRQISIPKQDVVVIDETEKELIFPYFSNGKEIEIYDPDNKKILTIPVGHFAEVTPSPTPTQEFNPTLAKNSGETNVLLFIGIGGLVLGISLAGYFFWQSRRRNSRNIY